MHGSKMLKNFRSALPVLVRGATFFAVGLALSATGTGASAQVVRGILIEEGTGVPIEGAMISAIEGSQRTRPLTMTEEDGAFRIDDLGPGSYVLRADRIGHGPAHSDTLDLQLDDSVHVEIVAPVEAIALEGIEARATARCAVRPEEGALTAQVWEEARKALEAASWTQDRELYRYRMLRYLHVLDPEGRLIREEERRYSEAWSQEPFTSHTAEHLTREGFISVSQEGGALYYAPDARVLLSDVFLDTHCMGVRRDPENHPGLLGLAFEPTEDREEEEIRGTLWLDEATGELEWLEFGYVNLGIPIRTDELGGRVDFHRMPDGTWIVKEWWIRMPRLGTEIVGRMIPRERTVLAGLNEEGGQVLTVKNEDGEVVLATQDGVIQGVVKDSLGQNPVAGARIQLKGIDGQEVTDTDGRFGFLNLGTGTYEVEWSHPRLDSMGVNPASHAVEVRRGEISTMEIEAPDPVAELARRCEASGGDTEAASKRRTRGSERDAPLWILMGRVLTPDGRPMAGATVWVRWDRRERGREPGEPVPREAPRGGVELTADEDGHFLSCGIPAEGEVRLHARLGPLATDTVSVESPEGQGPLYQELRVPGDGIRVPVPSILVPSRPDTTESGPGS